MNAREPFLLGDWTVDPASGLLTGAGRQRRLTPKLMDLLVALVERAGQVMSRDELLRTVWGARGAVSDEPLTRAVAELRKALGDDRAEPIYIETIPKRGYRVIAKVGAVPLAEPVASPGPTLQAVDRPGGHDALDGRLSLPADVTQAAQSIAPTADSVVPTVAPAVPSAESTAASFAAGASAPSAVSTRPPLPLSWWRLAAVMLGAAGVVAAALTIAFRDPAVSGPTRPVVGVAVLPFADLSPTADRQYFADGVHEDIIARLAGMPALRVASHSTVSSYRDAGKAVRQVARDLGVDAVMEGTVRYADQRVRVTAQLIDAATGTHVWAQIFDRPLTLENLFDIQAEIADGVAAGLTRSLAVGDAVPETALPTASLRAYEAFLLGKYHYRRSQPGDIQFATEQFQLAINADNRFADAWDWLAYAWLAAGADPQWTTPAEAFPRARAAALRALELDPHLWTASALLGFLRATYDWDWQAGLAELERAVAGAPHESGTVWSYAYVLSLLGRHDEAIALVRTLADTFPDDPRLRQEVAERAIDAGRFAEAAEAANAALAINGEPGQVRELLGVAAFGAGDLATAIAELERAVALQKGAAQVVGRLAATYAHAGRTADARALLTELETRAVGNVINVMTVARVYVALSDRERAYALLEQGLEERQRDVLTMGNDPFFAALRDEPRFVHIAERMGLPSSSAVR